MILDEGACKPDDIAAELLSFLISPTELSQNGLFRA
jgi:hypothetical protein